MYSFKDLVVASDPRMGDDEWLEYMRKKRQHSESADLTAEEIEAQEALDMKTRRKLSQAMRKNKAKIKRAKEIASKKKATKGTLEKRAQKQAIEIVKKKIAQGKDIKKMSFAARQQLDDKVKKKQGLVKKLAKRLLKKVKTDEKDRLTKKGENK